MSPQCLCSKFCWMADGSRRGGLPTATQLLHLQKPRNLNLQDLLRLRNPRQSLTPFPAHRADWSLFEAEVFGFSELDIADKSTATLRSVEDKT